MSAHPFLRNDQPQSGCWLNLFEPAIGELVGLCGYDYALIDMEHSPVGMDRALPMIRAVQLGGAKALVRAPGKEPEWVGRLMDAGADGVMIPMVNTPAEATALAAAARYAPEGTRGMAAGIVRGSRYGTRTEAYLEDYRDGFLLMAQIETQQAVESAESIIAVEGIDCIFFGPYDLAGSLGNRGEPDHKDTRAAIRSVMKLAKAAGKPVSTLPSPANGPKKLYKAGFDIVFSGSDLGLLRDAMSRDAELRP